MLLTQFGSFLEATNRHRRLGPLSAPSPYDPPYFISPKLDGVRCISFAPRDPGPAPKRFTGQLRTPAQPPLHTCYSRRGMLHPLLPSIERELWSLRVLAGDEGVTLDGELYLPARAGSPDLTSILATAPTSRTAPHIRRSLEEVSFNVFDLVSLWFEHRTPMNLLGDSTLSNQSLAAAALTVRNQTFANFASGGASHMRVVEGKTTFVERLQCMTFLFDLVKAAKSTQVRLPPSVGATSQPKGRALSLWEGLGEAFDTHLDQPAAAKSLEGDSPKSCAGGLKMVEHTAIWGKLEEAVGIVAQYVDEMGYEGAVVRSGLNLYQATPLSAHDADKTVRLGMRSATAVKLVPHVDKEFRVISIQHIRGVIMLVCSTDGGVCFSVEASAKQFPLLTKAATKSAKGCGEPLVGCFVTLQFPAFGRDMVPILPRLKGVRGMNKTHFL